MCVMIADLIAVAGRDFDDAPLFVPALLEHDAARRDARLGGGERKHVRMQREQQLLLLLMQDERCGVDARQTECDSESVSTKVR